MSQQEGPPMGPRPDSAPEPPKEPPPERDDTAVEPEPPSKDAEDEASGKAGDAEGKKPNGDTGIAKKPKPKAKAKAKAKAKKSAAKSASEKLAEAGERNRKREKELAAAKKVAAKGKAEPRPKSAEMLLANKATALATGRTVNKDGVIVGEQTRVFGAPVNSGQVVLIRDAVKGKNILQWLGCKEIELRRYAEGSIKASELPEAARKRLKELNGRFESRLKMWPRKDAAILYVLQQERKRGERKPKPSKPKPKPAPESVAA